VFGECPSASKSRISVERLSLALLNSKSPFTARGVRRRRAAKLAASRGLAAQRALRAVQSAFSAPDILVQRCVAPTGVTWQRSRVRGRARGRDKGAMLALSPARVASAPTAKSSEHQGEAAAPTGGARERGLRRRRERALAACAQITKALAGTASAGPADGVRQARGGSEARVTWRGGGRTRTATYRRSDDERCHPRPYRLLVGLLGIFLHCCAVRLR